jgi:ketosteroid isomerase-like protein
MSASEAANVEVVRRYYDACNAGDLDALLGTLTPDAVHYFLPGKFAPVRGAEWYVMRNGRIAEVRAYFIADAHASTELAGFPYARRGYSAGPGAASAGG